VTDPAKLGWPFAVARGHDTGYQLLLAPEFIATGHESGLLMSEVHGEVPDTAPPRTTTIAGPSSGPVALVYRTTRLTRADVGKTDRPEAAMLDRAGRPLLLAYGFVCRGVRVLAPDERDLKVARDGAIATYRRFRAAEADFLPEVSHPYHTRSTVAPIDTAPTRPPASPSTAPWTAEALPTRRPAPARRRPTTITALVTVFALAIFLIGYLASRADKQVDDNKMPSPSSSTSPWHRPGAASPTPTSFHTQPRP
jgi:hypothetical protein